ncbi:MAG: bacterioferritin [Acidocella sp. 20-63-7]|nr:MAG: bacterioferritin [Acidocella sp. 20-63-7]HQT47338.1 ferritin-like domain-containing protein [Acidocella sp.]
MSDPAEKNSFLRDVKTLRAQAQKSLEKGAVPPDYPDVETSIELLQSALATEIVCVLRYTMNSISVEGITSKSVGEEFAEHAKDEREHMMMIAERIDQLGGEPNFNPEGLASRSATEYGTGSTLVEMVRANLVAERIAIEHYRDLIKFFHDRDPSTRSMMEHILKDEEDHASDMHDLLVAHQGTPSLDERLQIKR